MAIFRTHLGRQRAGSNFLKKQHVAARLQFFSTFHASETAFLDEASACVANMQVDLKPQARHTGAGSSWDTAYSFKQHLFGGLG